MDFVLLLHRTIFIKNPKITLNCELWFPTILIYMNYLSLTSIVCLNATHNNRNTNERNLSLKLDELDLHVLKYQTFYCHKKTFANKVWLIFSCPKKKCQYMILERRDFNTNFLIKIFCTGTKIMRAFVKLIAFHLLYFHLGENASFRQARLWSFA